MADYTNVRLKNETADRLRLEAARLTVSTSDRWTMDRLINNLLDESQERQAAPPLEASNG